MVGIFWIVGVALILYAVYRQSKSHGGWYWYGFLGILGGMAILIAGFIVPLVHWATHRDAEVRSHVGLFVTVMLGGIFIFIDGVIYAVRKWSMAKVAGGPGPTIPASTLPAPIAPALSSPPSGFDQSSS